MRATTDELLEQARKMVRKGFTNRDIAHFLGIDRATLYRWLHNRPEFKAAMDRSELPEELRCRSRTRTKLYDQAYDLQAYQLCLLGYTNVKLASFFDVSRATIDKWIATIESFGDSVREGRAGASGTVASALLQRALGYSHKAVDIKAVGGKIVQTEYTKHYPPDTAAAIFWLKNREPELWKDRREVTIGDSEDLVPWGSVEASVDKKEPE